MPRLGGHASHAQVRARPVRTCATPRALPGTEAHRLPNYRRYKELKRSLNWTSADFLQYVKIKSLSAQQPDHMVVGVKSMGS